MIDSTQKIQNANSSITINLYEAPKLSMIKVMSHYHVVIRIFLYETKNLAKLLRLALNIYAVLIF